jgi:SAM-dependent methyltransferase
MADDPDHVRRNREAWNGYAPDYVASAERNWADAEPTWGIWSVPESQVGMFPPDLEGKDVVELGCGTAYVSAWMARRGARPVGLDNSPAQLATARRMQREHGLDFPLILADAERAPLSDASFDIAISEYGAAIWCDPYRWIPEAARLLRPGGELIFLQNGTILTLAMQELEANPATDRMRRPYFGMHRFEWTDTTAIEFHLGYGDWIRLLRGAGFEVMDLIEVRPPEGSTTTYTFVDLEWARKWPSEQVWKARKR